MSTNDVPGSNPSNGDSLSVGCWAEHKDGSLIFVNGAEGKTVVYSVFDFSRTPVLEYRDAMATKDFKKHYSWPGKSGEKWTWHDKTPFPWEKVIKDFPSGTRIASANDLVSAAQRVAENRGLSTPKPVRPELYSHMVEQVDQQEKAKNKARRLVKKLQEAIGKLAI